VLLPQAYPLGCPGHPAYPGGHAVIAGACATVLKAWFSTAMLDDGGVITSVADEVDALADDVSQGRLLAGVHFRSDNVVGLRFGQQVARAVLAEDRAALPEPCPPYRIRCFDGVVRSA
ncbi:MAG: phosphoesterase, partial [Candidatus Neomicrothrix subdominans]